MSTPVALILFFASLAATLVASALFARRLDRLGARLGIHEAVLGLLTALAADGPELSSGLTAMLRGERGVGVGVLLGSNIFNLAAMVGMSALLAGSVRLERPALALEGTFALFATAVTAAVLFAGARAVDRPRRLRRGRRSLPDPARARDLPRPAAAARARPGGGLGRRRARPLARRARHAGRGRSSSASCRPWS